MPRAAEPLAHRYAPALMRHLQLASSATPASSPCTRLRAAPHAEAAARLLGRVAALDANSLRAMVEGWHRLMNAAGEDWLAAEHAVALAVTAAGRDAEQAWLVEQLGVVFPRAPWLAGAPLGAPRVDATAASAEYVTTVAVRAVLVRDWLPAEDFGLLYAPLAPVMPAEALARE